MGRSDAESINVKVNVRIPKAEVERALASWFSEHYAPGHAPKPVPESISVTFSTNDNGFVCANMNYTQEVA